MVYTGFKQQAAEIAKQREGITHDFKDVTGGIEELAAFGFEISPEFKETSSESDTGKSEERTPVGQTAAGTVGGDQGPGGAKGYATRRTITGISGIQSTTESDNADLGELGFSEADIQAIIAESIATETSRSTEEGEGTPRISGQVATNDATDVQGSTGGALADNVARRIREKINGSNETSAEGKPVENNGRNNNEAGKGTKTLAGVNGQLKALCRNHR